MDLRSKQLREKYIINPICELAQPFSDSRGEIIPIIDEDMKSCVLITSKKGSIRANHFHKTDWHYCYVLSGKIDYFYRETGSDNPISQVVVFAGQCFFTPPLIDHTMKFLEDTVFICLGRNPRDQKSYEADIEKVVLL